VTTPLIQGRDPRESLEGEEERVGWRGTQIDLARFIGFAKRRVAVNSLDGSRAAFQQCINERSRTMKIDIGIKETDRAKIAQGLSRLLADTYTLYLKTHNFHWNVTGPMFQTLHLMFEQQYNELALAVDLIAERIRALGFPAPGTYREFAELSSIAESKGVPAAERMIRELVAGQEAVVKTARSVFPLMDKVNDEPSADLLTQRMQVHEKTAWMLRSLLA
jgi:starvation-inducible DNA-binding protein